MDLWSNVNLGDNQYILAVTGILQKYRRVSDVKYSSTTISLLLSKTNLVLASMFPWYLSNVG